MNELNTGQLVIKSNALIEASYRLTVQEQRIIFLVASMIKMEDEDFKTYFIEVQTFMNFIGVTGHSKYAEVKEITKKLRERTLIIKNEIKKSETQVGWVSSFTYFDNEGYVQIGLDPILKPYFLKLKEKFTILNLCDVVGMKSSYSIRIYELLKQYEKLKNRYFELSELKKYLGISENEYVLYGHFKQKILNRAQREISENTNFNISFDEKKKARKVVGILFSIEKKTTQEGQHPVGIDVQLLDIDIFLNLQQYFLLSSSQAQDALKSCQDKEEMKLILAHVERKHKAGELKDLPGYTLYAIKKRIKDQISLFDIESKEKERQKKIEEEQKRLEAERIEKLKVQFELELKHKALALFEQLNEEMKELLIQNCELSMEPFLFKNYMERGKKFQGASLESIFSQFIKGKLLSAEQRDFDLWLKNQS